MRKAKPVKVKEWAAGMVEVYLNREMCPTQFMNFLGQIVQESIGKNTTLWEGSKREYISISRIKDYCDEREKLIAILDSDNKVVAKMVLFKNNSHKKYDHYHFYFGFAYRGDSCDKIRKCLEEKLNTGMDKVDLSDFLDFQI